MDKPITTTKDYKTEKKQRKLRELKLDMNNLNEMNTNTFPNTIPPDSQGKILIMIHPWSLSINTVARTSETRKKDKETEQRHIFNRSAIRKPRRKK